MTLFKKGMTLNIEKLRNEIQRVIDGEMQWWQMNHSYLIDLIEVNGVSVPEEEAIRAGIDFRIRRDKEGGIFTVRERVYGTEIAFAWEEPDP